MARARISDEDGWSAVSRVQADPDAGRQDLATAVRFTLQLLAERAEGNTVEVRVPPFAAVQCIEGPRHTRGTPPNVVEMDAATWLALAGGALTWQQAVETARVHASGLRADLSEQLPIAGFPSVLESPPESARLDQP
ncbi:sterol carrier family protein [Amnibacterium flavum]|uniref:Bacterial SCP orthologue domain-containing protein n=1 Tax=Amnibacterium flavum TaxID=2173173 RepID=A0A2V1HW28_9MICO|nr:sterol carrier family protein [Amnibacterium flavum]PVZ95339.1 hypothetical protein DDQ50_02120 [Amnibacterium flavum]